MDFDDDMVPVEGGCNIEAYKGPVNVQPGVGAPPPPALIESQEAPALIKPSKMVIRHLTKLLALKGRKAQRVREAFKSMISVVAAEHKFGLKVIQLCLVPWWPYKVSADPNVIFEPDAIWPLQVVVPERLTLTTKRSRDKDADGEKIITLEALPSLAGQIDMLVAGIMLLHDKEPLTQRTLANCVYMAQKTEHLSAAEAATAVFFERTMLHGHPVPSDMVAVCADVVLAPGHIYLHERRFPKERPATCDTRPMCELHDSFIVWEKTAVMKVGEDGE